MQVIAIKDLRVLGDWLVRLQTLSSVVQSDADLTKLARRDLRERFLASRIGGVTAMAFLARSPSPLGRTLSFRSRTRRLQTAAHQPIPAEAMIIPYHTTTRSTTCSTVARISMAGESGLHHVFCVTYTHSPTHPIPMLINPSRSQITWPWRKRRLL